MCLYMTKSEAAAQCTRPSMKWICNRARCIALVSIGKFASLEYRIDLKLSTKSELNITINGSEKGFQFKSSFVRKICANKTATSRDKTRARTRIHSQQVTVKLNRSGRIAAQTSRRTTMGDKARTACNIQANSISNSISAPNVAGPHCAQVQLAPGRARLGTFKLR